MFLELSFDLGALDPEAAEDAGFACGACAVTFEDARDDPVLEPMPGEVRLWPATRVRCLFADEAPPRLAEMLAAALGLQPAELSARPVADRAWEREWLRDLHAMRFGRRLWVCPRHEQVTEPGAVVVRLDPGLAFGTGTHATTALCLEWLDAHLSPGTCVIDYGCGSGILGVAAARLGASAVHGFDIDPQALTAMRDNAEVNDVMARVRLHESAATLPREADLLVANILAGTLCALAPSLAGRLRRGGHIVLAGLLAHEVADVTEAYAPCFDVGRAGERDGWVCLAGRRR